MESGIVGLPKKALSIFLALLLAISLGTMPAYAAVEDVSLSDSTGVSGEVEESNEGEVAPGDVSAGVSGDSVGSAEEEQMPALDSTGDFTDESEGSSMDAEDGFEGDESAAEILDNELGEQKKKSIEKDVDEEYESNVGSIASGEKAIFGSDYKKVCEFVYDGESIIYGYAEATLYLQSNSEYLWYTGVDFEVYGFDYYGVDWDAPIVSCKSSDSSVATVKDWGTCLALKAKKRGTCTITVKIAGGVTKKIKVTVTNGVPKLRWTSYELYGGQYFNNKILYNDSKVKWSSTNKKVAKVSSTGKVTAVGLGTCYIKAKVAGKTLKCKVKVVRRSPNFGAYLYDYNSRNNYFVVKIRNKGSRTLYIRSGVKAEDCDYKHWDRKIYLKKSVAIKPNTTKYVRFYVSGKYAWPDYTDYTIFYKFKYDGRVYEGHTWDEDSVFKKNGKWYNTYWDEDWYWSWS